MNYKVLSVKQPWSYLLCIGVKNYENRTWRLPEKYKGERVLIHASAKPNADFSLPSMLSREQYKCAEKHTQGLNALFAKFDTSAIIGSVRFTDCVINADSIWAEKSEEVVVDPLSGLSAYKRGDSYSDKPIYNWKAEDAILFDKPILNVKGKLSFWDFDLPEEYVKILGGYPCPECDEACYYHCTKNGQQKAECIK